MQRQGGAGAVETAVLPAGLVSKVRYLVCLLTFCAVLTGPLAAAEQAAAKDPAAVVQELHDTLLGVMKNAKKLGFEGRRKLLAPVIPQVYDMEVVTRVVLGSHWASLSDQQRDTMVDVFTRLTMATYANRFDGYNGQRFVTLETRSLKEDRALVRTELQSSGGDHTSLDYVLQKQNGDWRIVNVVADGVSDLALKRAQYSSIIDNKGFDALIADLERQITEYARGSGS